ncbi:hypothetical protein TSOC_011120, partial [Tetrabaena socialis]
MALGLVSSIPRHQRAMEAAPASLASCPIADIPLLTLLATGGTDRRVALYLRPPGGGGRFSLACALEGHENWVRGVAFCHVRAEEAAAAGGAAGGAEAAPQLLLASVSQDRYGRIWKLQPELPGGGGSGGAGAAANVAAGSDPAEDPLAALIRRYAPRPSVETDKT